MAHHKQPARRIFKLVHGTYPRGILLSKLVGQRFAWRDPGQSCVAAHFVMGRRIDDAPPKKEWHVAGKTLLQETLSVTSGNRYLRAGPYEQPWLQIKNKISNRPKICACMFTPERYVRVLIKPPPETAGCCCSCCARANLARIMSAYVSYVHTGGPSHTGTAVEVVIPNGPS